MFCSMDGISRTARNQRPLIEHKCKCSGSGERFGGVAAGDATLHVATDFKSVCARPRMRSGSWRRK